jgi:hypothetical protein
MNRLPPETTPTNYRTIKVRAHVPALIEEVKHVFYGRHKRTPTVTDVLVNALKCYKDNLRTA